MMKYLSTRGHPERKSFCEILLEGLAPDGGLYLPESYPQVSDATLNRWRTVYHTQGYAELAFEILSLYIDDIPAADLRAICQKTPRWPTSTWPCSCWATCSNMSWRAAAKS